MKPLTYLLVFSLITFSSCKKEYTQLQGQAIAQKLASTLSLEENQSSTTLYNVVIAEDSNTTILYQSTLFISSNGILVLTLQGREISFNLEELKYFELSSSNNLTLKF